jgi:hypothetical protein
VIVERPTLERRVLTSIEAGRIPVLLGGCGSGRTSLLLRLEALIGRDRSQYLDIAAAATTPERCFAAVLATTRLAPPAGLPREPASTRDAVDLLLHYFDHALAPNSAATFLLDEFLDVRTFESFPGLRHVQRDLIARLATSPARFVLASRFTARVHRLLRDAPARFEVIHVPPLETPDVQAMAHLFVGGRREWASTIAPAVTALSAGSPTAAHVLLAGLAAMGQATDPVAALAAAIAPDGALTARCRECYELRLHRARGYPRRARRQRAVESHRDLARPPPDAGLDEGLFVVARGRRSDRDARQALLVRRSAAPPVRAALRQARAAERRRRAARGGRVRESAAAAGATSVAGTDAHRAPSRDRTRRGRGTIRNH